MSGDHAGSGEVEALRIAVIGRQKE